ncbi:MAG TPA: 50S ribosomal protein L21e [Thermoplasmata archaeon]|nr:50S ribosomal protein L21e [Thermoplasmata archaeon]
MVKASKGIMEGSRQKLRRRVRERGLSPITRSLQSFEVGDKATIVIDGSRQKGWPHHRFHGLTGTVVERRGRAYVIDVRFGGKVKQAIVSPEHLRRA